MAKLRNPFPPSMRRRVPRPEQVIGKASTFFNGNIPSPRVPPISATGGMGNGVGRTIRSLLNRGRR